MRNLNLLFNKTYYDSLTPSSFSGADEMNKLIFSTTFSNDRDYSEPGPMVTHSFLLTVCYPGLLVGIGINHDAGMNEDEIGVGFSFDYVTGQPYIPGSTVKGVLRSHFKDHPQVIMELCGKDRDWVARLETEIFEYSDIFFDAVVYDGDASGLLMGKEYITPHKSPTENPVPIKLLKVLPEVRFSFRFRLRNSPCMTADEKEALLRKLLCLFGIGAKTRVGFGVLREDETNGQIHKKMPVPAAPSRTSAPLRKEQRSSRPQAPGRPVDRIVCPHCGTLNHRCKPNSTEQWPNWPKCRNMNCRKDLL